MNHDEYAAMRSVRERFHSVNVDPVADAILTTISAPERVPSVGVQLSLDGTADLAARQPRARDETISLWETDR